jgi:hypothetical protein
MERQHQILLSIVKENNMINAHITPDNWFNLVIYIIMFGAIYLALLVGADE